MSSLLPRRRLLLTPLMVDPAAILAIIRPIDAAAALICNEIDKVLELKPEEQPALEGLRKGVEKLKSGLVAFNVLLSATRVDPGFTVVLEGEKERIESLERALNATRLLLEEVPDGSRYGATVDPSGNRKPIRALKFVLSVLKTNFRPRDLLDLIGEATHEIFVCQQNNQRAFKLVWYHYVISQQRASLVLYIQRQGRTNDDRLSWARRCVSNTFDIYPFAVSPERVNHGYESHILAILNHNREFAIRHEALARQLGQTWVDDRVRGYVGEIRELGALQTSLFELLWSGTVEQLKGDSPYSSDDPERPGFERTVEELERVLQETIVCSKRQHFSIVFCGMVNAGKSLFLNALMGRSILPSNELPSAALPCRLRHVEGYGVPELRFQATPFLIALEKLQYHRYGQKMQTYQPPPENMFGTPLSDAPPEPSEEEILLRTVHSQWADLHAVTRANLLKFETPGFHLPLIATGDLDVKILLGQLNDIVRLCQRFDLKFDMSEVHWPLLTIEFNSLRGLQMDGIYEFIDLPDIGEDFCGFNFESLVRLVASESNAIAPIVPFKELPHGDWKRLPALVASGFEGRPNVVVCTHLDQVSQENMDKQLKTVTKAFWPRGVLNTNCVIPCSLMGLSARYLLDRSNTTKPPFEAIWDKHYLGYHCAAKILGVEDPRVTYDRFDIQMWQDKLQAELRASGLSGDTQRLAKKMVDSARVNALLSDADTVIRQLREIRLVYEQTLLIEAERLDAELDAAERRYNEALEISKAALETLGRVESMQTQEVRLFLEQKSGIISQKACGLINETIIKSLTDSGMSLMSLEDMDVVHDTRSVERSIKGIIQFDSVHSGNGDISGNLQESSSAEAAHSIVLVTETRAQAKDFLRLSQRELSSALETLKKEYAAMILDLAELQPLPQYWEDCIGDLVPAPLNIDEFAFQEICGVINSSQATLLSRQYSIEIDTLHDRFKNDIVDPWITKLKEEGEATLFGINETTSALLEKALRCKHELEKMERLDGEETVERLTAVYSNLCAAEGALGQLASRLHNYEMGSNG